MIKTLKGVHKVEYEFKVGDWVIDRGRYLGKLEANNIRKVLINKDSFPQEIIRIDKLNDGKTVYHLNKIWDTTEHIKAFSLATEMEIKNNK
jgi:hypothetical protein